MLITHRQSAYVDVGELERAAGMCEALSKTEQDGGAEWAGAARALRVLQCMDVKTAEDLLVMLRANVFRPYETEA